MMQFGIRIRNVSLQNFELIKFRLMGTRWRIDYQDGNVLVYGEDLYWRISLLLGDCLCFGDIECSIIRGDRNE